MIRTRPGILISYTFLIRQPFPSCTRIPPSRALAPIAKGISMLRITTLFWDIGGVILTNGWDRGSRKAAMDAFQLDSEEFQDRHELSFPAFDAGQISII